MGANSCSCNEDLEKKSELRNSSADGKNEEWVKNDWENQKDFEKNDGIEKNEEKDNLKFEEQFAISIYQNDLAKINEFSSRPEKKDGNISGAVKSLMISETKDKFNLDESRKKALRIINVSSLDEILAADSKKNIFEGEIWKYTPGAKQTYSAKWGQITNQEFRYFRDRISSTDWLAQPLQIVSLGRIAGAKRVNVWVTKGVGKSPPSTEFKQFEIILKEEEKPFRDRPATIFNEFSASPQEADECRSHFTSESGNYKLKLKEELKNQTASSWIPSLSGLNTLSSREQLAKITEHRCIFGVKSAAEVENWILVINLMVDLNSS